jgi:hypothetical protein
MALLVNDDSGRIEYGLFFLLDAYRINRWRKYKHALINLSLNDQPLHVVAIDSVEEEFATGRCVAHPQEPDFLKIYEVEVQLFGGASDGKFLSGLDGGYLYVNERIAEAVLQADFRGARFANISVNYNSSHIDGSSLRVMCFDGCSAYRPKIIVPPEANRCHICGFAPIVCSICDYFNHSCPVCNADLVSFNFDDTEAPVKFAPDSGEYKVISLDRWDGSDFLGGDMIVTGRVVDFLFSFEPQILCAQALRCYVGDHSEEEYRHLRSRRFQEAVHETQ